MTSFSSTPPTVTGFVRQAGPLRFDDTLTSVLLYKVKLALDEAKLNYTAYEFETHGSKPDWYYGINPIGKVRPSHVFSTS